MDNENSGILPATEKQKQYIIDLTENMTREQAGRVIEALKNKAADDYTPAKPNSELPITEKQKAYIKDILAGNGMDYDEEELNNMTRSEASQLISSHRGQGAE
jgi:hypothetical protein